ncbi:putative ADP-ribosylation factor family protein [Forsythia ovata]|uniref:ADP-ribosylation factor-like protein 2 n=1 Tax=Forsythia ovata TaxID=205694 RepID=A0ABD1VIL0_9LAMI
MGLLSIIRKIKRKEKEMRILMVGLDNSGKTTIVLKINGEDTSIISPTLGFNIKTINYQKYVLNIWDVGGQKTIRSYWRNYFEQTDGFIWVVDSSDLRRLDDCKHELDNLLKEERLSGASLLIFANKQDIQGALSPEEIAKVLNLDAMDKTRHWRIVGCSAYTGDGLLEGFDWLGSLNTAEQRKSNNFQVIGICPVMEAKFFRFLKIVGVGFKARAEAEGRLLYLKLGYSHEVELTVPPAVRVFCFKNNVVCCTGIDKERVHQFAAAVRCCKPPEVYKGKGSSSPAFAVYRLCKGQDYAWIKENCTD